jgi:hypothetical protein
MRTSASRGSHTATRATLHECKVRASLLLKALRSDDPARQLVAAERFRVLPAFARLTPERIAAWRTDIRRKHALAVIAAEFGYPSWTALRDASTAENTSMEWLFERGKSVFLNHWCTTYEEAAEVRARTDGFLFPYRHQFVVCSAQLLADRGLDPYDPDWARIGRDWARPRDRVAFARLVSRVA